MLVYINGIDYPASNRMKITSIKQQVKNAERVSVFVDGKYTFSLSLDELLAHKLKTNDELGAHDVKKFKKISADGKLRARALEWLMRDYLYRKKAETEQIENLVNEFSKKGYLDNEKFAAWFAELQARRGKSNRAIRSELFKKGIGRELADEVLANETGDEALRLNNMIEKKSKLSRYKNNPQKLTQYLVSQGFSYADVRSAIIGLDEEA
jgi:regulatory protein